MFGSATAETSASVRRAQPVSVCQDGLGSYGEQPEPVPSPPALLPQTVSVQPRELRRRVSEVPPTAVTYWRGGRVRDAVAAVAGEAVTATPGWL